MSLWKFIGRKMRSLRDASGRTALHEAVRRGMEVNTLLQMEAGEIKPIPADDSGIPPP